MPNGSLGNADSRRLDRALRPSAPRHRPSALRSSPYLRKMRILKVRLERKEVSTRQRPSPRSRRRCRSEKSGWKVMTMRQRQILFGHLWCHRRRFAPACRPTLLSPLQRPEHQQTILSLGDLGETMMRTMPSKMQRSSLQNCLQRRRRRRRHHGRAPEDHSFCRAGGITCIRAQGAWRRLSTSNVWCSWKPSGNWRPQAESP
mmetsp:Transcript_92024/g.166175  ORF Transcript_92024/g.166175 Transcript_92024/m.166175 type:complete len:202 (+) Transcript_92024:741-1346(+)